MLVAYTLDIILPCVHIFLSVNATPSPERAEWVNVSNGQRGQMGLTDGFPRLLRGRGWPRYRKSGEVHWQL
ncbi:hypothetical protein F4774DRAFT_386648 [Daldinia eschscholtzii]|nr:hypothetical protein F4774DRAFT_386648 [Daldinia eschscholtzii]